MLAGADFRIVDAPKFLKEVAGSDQHFRLDEFADTMRSRIVSLFSEALAQAKIPVLDVATRYSEVGAALLPLINPVTTSKYGIEFTSFVIENVSGAAGNVGVTQALKSTPDGYTVGGLTTIQTAPWRHVRARSWMSHAMPSPSS